MNQQDNGGLTGNASGLQNCITPIPYTYGVHQYYYPPTYQAQIREVKNGFIVNLDGNETVYETVESMLEGLSKRFKKVKNGK
jgi:hypothetical protein